MRSVRKLLGVGLLGWLLLTGSLARAATEPGGALQRPDQGSAVFQRFSLEEGLSQSEVNSLAFDGDGYLWIGTQDGLNRFDGY